MLDRDDLVALRLARTAQAELLLLARADAGEVPLSEKPSDLAAIAEEVAEMFEFLAEERAIQLVTETTVPVPVLGDPSRLRQLVTNLLDNAIRFTEPAGSVALQVEAVGERALLRVRDTGRGIPSDHLPHVFERFYQEDTARTSGGCGLGLSICRWIVEAHGGSIEAESRDGQGTAFTVSLPLTRASAPVSPTETSKNAHGKG